MLQARLIQPVSDPVRAAWRSIAAYIGPSWTPFRSNNTEAAYIGPFWKPVSLENHRAPPGPELNGLQPEGIERNHTQAVE